MKSQHEVFWVDTYSFQIREFLCPVGTVAFCAPEIQGKNFSTFRRTQAHENFAVATLLFMLLVPGKQPYAQQGGGTPGENIRRQDFSYPLKEKSNRKAPEGPWRFIWSNLPYRAKEAFYETFAENRRRTVRQWLGIW